MQFSHLAIACDLFPAAWTCNPCVHQHCQHDLVCIWLKLHHFRTACMTDTYFPFTIVVLLFLRIQSLCASRFKADSGVQTVSSSYFGHCCLLMVCPLWPLSLDNNKLLHSHSGLERLIGNLIVLHWHRSIWLADAINSFDRSVLLSLCFLLKEGGVQSAQSGPFVKSSHWILNHL